VSTYHEAQTHGRQAEARVGGTLRGGYVYEGRFWTMAGTQPIDVHLSRVSDLRDAPYPTDSEHDAQGALGL